MALTSDLKAGASGISFEPSSQPLIPGVDDFLVASREMLPLMQASSSFAQPPDTVHATPLHAVAVNGDRSQLTSLITSGAYDLDCGDQYGRTPLVYSVLGDRLDCAEVLLKAGAQVNMADMDGRTALHWAAYQDNFRCLRLLLSKGANWRAKDNEGRTALHLATGHQNTKCLKEFLRKIKHGSHDINDADTEQMTALHWSAYNNNPDAIRLLIKAGADVVTTDMEGKNCLHWTAGNADGSSVRTILELCPAVVNLQDNEGRTALHLAVAEGNEHTVHALTAMTGVRCEVASRDNMFRTPLHWAAVLADLVIAFTVKLTDSRYTCSPTLIESTSVPHTDINFLTGHSHIVGLLLEKNADYSSSDGNGATALHYATGGYQAFVLDANVIVLLFLLQSQNNFSETVATFLSFPHVKDEKDNEGRTALMWAAGKGGYEVVRTMMERKLDVHAFDKQGGTALHAAAFSGHANVVRLLIQHNANVNVLDSRYHTPLFRACEMGHTEVVVTLLNAGASVDIVDADGRAPLHWAALGGHAYICMSLIQHNATADINDRSGRTPLQCASYGGFLNCVTVLLESGADPNARDSEGITAIHWACSSGHLDCIRLLFEYGANPNFMEIDGERLTPLDYAIINDHQQVAQFMIEHGAMSISSIEELAAAAIQGAWRNYVKRKSQQESSSQQSDDQQIVMDKPLPVQDDKKQQREAEARKRAIERRAELEKQLCEAEQLDDKTQYEEIRRKQRRLNQEERLKRELSTQSQTSLFHRDTVSMLRQHSLQDQQELARKERMRLANIRQKTKAALVIQLAWRKYLRQKRKRQAMAPKRRASQMGSVEWRRQIAALTIQLAWRKYLRRKLLKLYSTRQKILYEWSPSVLAAKQRALVEKIYSQPVKVVEYRPPSPKPMVRPAYFRYIPSQAALSFNFAVDQYNPMTARLGMSRALELKPGSTRVRPFSLYRGSSGWSRDSPRTSKGCGTSRGIASGVLF